MGFSIGGAGFPNFGIYGIDKAQQKLSQSIERISSGLSINRGADNAAGLAISEGLRGQIRGLGAASSNVQSGISLARVAEGGLSNIQENIQRIRELTIQAGNGSYTDDERKALQDEANQLLAGINDISSRTEFNTKKLLDGSQAARVSSGTAGVEAYTKGAVASGTYTGQVVQRTGADGEIVRELQLRDQSGNTKTSVLDQNFRAKDALGNLDVQLQELTTAKVEAGDSTSFEDTITFGGAAASTFTDSLGNSVAINFAAGNVTSADLVNQINTAFTGAAVGLTASLSSEGDLVIQGSAGADYTVSGTNADFTSALGFVDGVIAAPSASESARFEGYTNPSVLSEGVEFNSSVSFDVNDSSGSVSSVALGGAGVTLTKSQILDSINTQLSDQGALARASFDSENRLQFESLDAGSQARVSVTDTSAGADDLASVFNFQDQARNGSGATNFVLNVSGTGLAFQNGANPNQSSSFAVGNFSSDSLGISGVDFSTDEGRRQALESLDSATEQVYSARSSLGAQENAFVSQYENLGVANINLSSTDSLIRDANLALQAVESAKADAQLKSALFAQTQTLNLNRNLIGLLG